MTIRTLRSFVGDCKGATITEYALVLALIAAVCVIAVSTIGTVMQHTFGTIGGKL